METKFFSEVREGQYFKYRGRLCIKRRGDWSNAISAVKHNHRFEVGDSVLVQVMSNGN